MRRVVLAAMAALFPAVGLAQAVTPTPAAPAIDDSARGRATVVANVVALEQPLLYNRFGSHNPHGMIYALARDVVVRPGHGGSPDPASARLRDGKRPRPLVLRMNVRDTLEIRFLNLLPPDRNGRNSCSSAIGGGGEEATDWPRTACAGVSVVGLPLAQRPAGGGGDIRFEFGRDPDGGQDERQPAEAKTQALAETTLRCEDDIAGSGGEAAARQGLVAQHPGECRVYRFTADRPGAHLLLSHAAPAGGQGDGGALSHGLFGVIVVEREGSRWYRSQVDAETFKLARDAARALPRADRARGPFLHYEAHQNGVPLLNIAREPQQATGDKTLEIVHGDLNAIVYCPLEERKRKFDEQASSPQRTPAAQRPTWHCASEPMREAAHRADGAQLDPSTEWWRATPAHRTFTVVFHDELKTRYVPPFDLLDPEVRLARMGGTGAADGAAEPQGIMLDGIRDGFAINYGASGMGTILLANRLGLGPARDCAECLHEEFFLQSWANGDPALLTPPLDEVRDALPERAARGARLYPDDPSNVHHGYLGDRVVFHNLHAGPKETHVFHLHAHQWRAGSDGQGAYRDSQTVAPLQAFSYEIDHGGGGNLNLTPGDAIFHCHLYPHFAQGMWALWRNHDVLEDGTRRLPDGVLGPGTDPGSGKTQPDKGVPIPAVVPLPGQGMPPLPTYDDEPDPALAGRPGYPFFIPAGAGHRAPQPPMDMHHDEGRPQDGGLPRHRIAGPGERSGPNLVEAIAEGNFVLRLEAVDLELLPPDGDLRERRAMAFHAAQALPDRVKGSDGVERAVPAVPAPGVRDPVEPSDVLTAEQAVQDGRGAIGFYRLPRPDTGAPALFRVNGRAPQPGAPFADPCRDTEPDGPSSGRDPPGGRYARSPLRVYDVSAVELDLVVNAAGWHDPQAHINVLTAEAESVEGRRMRAAPFFYRAHSGDCVEYRHQNRTKGALELDDFQAATPTDTIGQHIHLVKFDVLAADGSANGWNYEDGTFAASHIRDRVEAANRLGGARGLGGERQLLPAPGPNRFQATVQRWYADRVWQQADVSAGPTGGPCTQGGKTASDGKECRDVTLRTVFTHDHFGPSSIQQHGFYSALLVEPEESTWFTADGRLMCSSAASMPGGEPKDGCVMPVTQLFPPEAPEGDDDLFASARALWRPNAQALIVGAGGNDPTRAYNRDHREFPMAIADFALLYAPGPPEVKPVSPLLASEGRRAVMRWRHTRGNGWPVDPPEAPEAISQRHHNPYLVNFGHDPLPLRIGRHSRMPQEEPPEAGARAAGEPRARCPQTRVNNRDEIRTQRAPLPNRPDLADPGDLANAFDSWCHGDPFAEIFEAYEGEEIQIRLIQGAQEVQHVFNAPGLRWRRDLDVTYGAQGTARDVGDRFQRARGQGAARDQRTAREMQSGFVSSQEVGISEHFEFLTTADNINGQLGAADFLWHFGSKDAIWNGAWGLIRFHDGTITTDQKQWQAGGSGEPTPDATCAVAREMALARGEARPDCDAKEVRDRLLSVRAARRSIVRPDKGGPPEAFGRQRDGEHAYQSPRLHFPEEPGDRQGLAASSCPSNVAWWLQPAGQDRALRQGAAVAEDPSSYWQLLPVEMRSYEVIAEPDAEPNGRGREVWQGEGGRIYDPRPLRFRAVRMATGKGVLPPPESEYRPLPPAPADEGPLVLRARAGECVHVRLLHRAPGGALNPVEGEARLPGITSLNVTYENVRGPDGRPLDLAALGPEALRKLGVVLPSRRVSLLPQLVHQDPLDAGVLAGINSRAQDPDQAQAFRRLAAEREAVDYMWFAGVTIPDPKQPHDAENPDFTRVGFAVDFGPVPLASVADPFFHPAHGLVGTLVVHEADARLAPRPGASDGGWTAPGTPVWLGRDDAKRNGPFDYTDAVLVFRDGLNHHFRSSDRTSAFANGRPLADCPVCDDSYDRGERAAGWRAEPLWARLMRNPPDRQRAVFPQPRALPPGGDPPPNMLPTARLDGQPAFEGRPDLNAITFPRNHFLNPAARTPTIQAFENIQLRLHVLQPAGRARQRVFTVLGHDYRDGAFGPALSGDTPQPTDSGQAVACGRADARDPNGDTLGASGWYGAPGASLLGPGRAVTAVIHCPNLGRWLWRDGPAPMLDAGVWGWMDVHPRQRAPVAALPRQGPAEPRPARAVEARR